MNVIIDACVWSTALRRATKSETQAIVNELKELVGEQRAVLLGPIRQEILSGLREPTQFNELREHLKSFEDYPIASEDYEYAAELFNYFRSRGIQGSNTDFIMVAVAVKHSISIFTTDKDFKLYLKHMKFNLHEIRK